MAIPSEKMSYLHSVRLFTSLSPAELERAGQKAFLRKLETGNFLFFQGEMAEKLFVVFEGQIKLSQVTPEGQQVIIRYATTGDTFGVAGVAIDVDYPVSAEAAEDSLVAGWDRDVMRSLMMEIPQIAINTIAILALRAHEFQDRVKELSTERVERRIARTLLRLVRQVGRKVDKGVLIDLPLSRQDLAELSGTTLYTASRVLSGWESQGLVKTSREQVIVTYPHGLVMIAEDLKQ